MTGWSVLLRSHLRRDRWLLLWWSAAVVLLFWSQGVSVLGLYDTQEEFERAAAVADDNPAFIAMAGPARALDTVGGQVFWQAAALGAVLVGLMSMFLVGRHTRTEEESGRDELVRSAAIGRHAPATAALVLALLANLLVGVLVALSLLTVRGGGSPLVGVPLALPDTVATGAGLAACGWMFSATALVAAQLTQSTRGMYGIAGAVVGVAYALRAVGDVGSGVLSWLSPIGWYQAMAAYADLRWWPLGLLLVAAGVVAATAYLLLDRRDAGSGLWAARPGPAGAGTGLRSALGLAWRLHRGALLGWTVGLLVTGLAYGSIGDSVADLIGDGDIAELMGGGVTTDLVDGFYATSAVTLGLLAAGFAIASTLRPRAEEDAGHVEALLATGLSRWTWLGGHVLVTVVGTVVVVAAAGLGMGAGYAATTGDGDAVLRLALPTLAQVAPVLVLAAVGRLLYGAAPRLLVLAWVPLALSVVVLMFSEPLQIPEAVQALSPFEHLAFAPAEDFRWAPVLVLLALAATLSLGGQVAFRRRDIG
ncbi:ABC transporter permease [Nocardioides sp. SYSU DS0651]|uniref:ABC transporter permease n=1 Tax=Nocardioides sp. SYSU DS0651 TaxID=3415955 RepID=UPI003F4B34B6